MMTQDIKSWRDMKKFLVFIIIVTCTLVLPYIFHARVYRFYMKQYYSLRYGENNGYMFHARELYNRGKYEELADFAEPLLIVYYDDNELRRLAGMSLIKLKRELEGAALYTSGMEKGYSNDYEAAKVIKILYNAKNYGDVIYYYDRKILRDYVDTSFYYGVSLLKYGRVDEAYAMLLKAEKERYGDTRKLFYYLGLVYEQKKNDRAAYEYLMKAYRSGAADDDLVKDLVRVCRNLKLFEQAELLLRKRKY